MHMHVHANLCHCKQYAMVQAPQQDTSNTLHALVHVYLDVKLDPRNHSVYKSHLSVKKTYILNATKAPFRAPSIDRWSTTDVGKLISSMLNTHI